ncbi:MAG: metallophosphoesterase [Anaerolineales bacterium]|nr:metallophosphoesterase [Anaerolineales bacterium]
MAVSDQVLDHIYTPHLRQKYPDIDLIIGCGDLPFYYLEFLASALDAPLLYVLGNHDRGPQYTVDGRRLTSVQGGKNIHAHVVNEKGVLIAGLEGSMRYRPGAPLMYTESEMRREVLRLLPSLLWNRLRYGRYLDILVTHSPPKGIHDRDDLAHRGFAIFRPLLEWLRPKLMIHGHIHLYQQGLQETNFAETRIVNVYPLHVFEYEPPA